MIVELDRDPAQYPDSNVVEVRGQASSPSFRAHEKSQWVRSATNQQALDGFTIRRRGDSVTRVRVLLYLDQYPEQFKIHPELGSILGIKEESRPGVIHALWNYIKLQDLQDKVDRRVIRADPALAKVRCLSRICRS